MKKTRIIDTSIGKIQGFIENNLKIFKGIPYAEPPIGDLRFQPPIHKKPFKEVFFAKEFGPSSFQGPAINKGLFGKLSKQNEDNCLTLNIWTPKIDDKKRPVMVWIHGGGFIYSGSSRDIYDGKNLSNRGNIVIVTLNYRLGIFGYLYIPEVIANIGMLDQIAALNWIKKNIDKFGGDPNNVTIFGESAGANSVVTLMAMPSAKGLFQHAIAQSPYIFEADPPLRTTRFIMNKLNLEIDDIESLRKIPGRKLQRIQNNFLKEVEGTPKSYYSNFRPCIDGKTLPHHPYNALKQGLAKDIELIIGSNQNEATFFTFNNPIFQRLDEETLELKTSIELNRLKLQSKTKYFIEEYKKIKKESSSINPMDIYNAIYTDLYYRIPAIRIMEAKISHNKNVFSYLFNWTSPMFKSACHSLDLPFTFGYINNNVKSFVGSLSKAKKVSNRLMDTWIKFSYFGNPNNSNIPTWSPYDLKKRLTLLINKKFKIMTDPFKKRRILWNGIYEF